MNRSDIALVFALLSSQIQAATLSELAAEEEGLVSQFTFLTDERSRSTDLRAAIRAGDRGEVRRIVDALKRSQIAYDTHARRLGDHMAEHLERNLICLYDREVDRINQAKRSTRKTLVNEYRNAFLRLREFATKRDYFGQDLDHERIEAFKLATEHAQAFSDGLHRLSGRGVSTPRSAETFAEMGGGLTSLPEIRPILHAMHFQIFSPQGKTPVLDAFGDFLLAKAKKFGTNLSWKGVENVPDPIYDGRTIRIYAHTHANAYYDMAALGLLRLPGVGLIGNAYHTMGLGLATQFGRADHVILAGRDDRAMTDKTISVIRKRKLDGVNVSLEAYSSMGLYETRPVRNKFVDAIIKPFKDRGMAVDVVPMTMPDTYRIMNEWRYPLDPNHSEVESFVHPMIPDAERVALEELSDDPYSINWLLRATWLEHLRFGEGVNFSRPETAELQRRFDQWVFDGEVCAPAA